MKKFILLFLLILFSASKCNKTNEFQIYEFQQQYSSSQEQKSIDDVYLQLKHYNVDSLNLDKWITINFNESNDTIIEKFVIAEKPDSALFVFIYTKFITIDSTHFEFKIRKTYK